MAHILIKIIVFTLNFIIFLHTDLRATNPFEEQHQVSHYHQHHDNQQDAAELHSLIAIGSAQAQHNQAIAALNDHRDEQAYYWFIKASLQGHVPAQQFLKQLDLFNKISSAAMRIDATHRMSFKQAFALDHITSDSHLTIESLIVSTNYMNTALPFLKVVILLFDRVIFSNAAPQQIRLSRAIKSADDIKIHFRDSQHLREIAERIPVAQAKRVIFVRDDDVKDGQEVYPYNKHITDDYYLYLSASDRLILSGAFPVLDILMVLPQKSASINFNHNLLAPKITAIDSCTSGQARYLADMIDTFDDQVSNTCTTRVEQLFNQRRLSRQLEPHLYPSFVDLCSDCGVVGGPDLKIEQQDYIASDGPFTFIAKSITRLKNLWSTYPDFNKSVALIDTRVEADKIYSRHPLFIIKGFEVATSGHLAAFGSLNIPEYNILFNAGKDSWCYGLRLNVYRFDVDARAIHGDYFDPRDKPSMMPDEVWGWITDFLRAHGILEPNIDKALH